MKRPVLIIINGLPGSGKTTLSRRLAADLPLPLFSRDGIYETLYNALAESEEYPPYVDPATFPLLYAIAGSVLAAGQSALVEGFFGRPEIRSPEFLSLRYLTDFEPLQILCKADGKVLLKRFLARMNSTERHAGHHDRAWIEQNRSRLLRGYLSPLELPGQLIEVDTTSAQSFIYEELLQQVRAVLQSAT